MFSIIVYALYIQVIPGLGIKKLSPGSPFFKKLSIPKIHVRMNQNVFGTIFHLFLNDLLKTY